MVEFGGDRPQVAHDGLLDWLVQCVELRRPKCGLKQLVKTSTGEESQLTPPPNPAPPVELKLPASCGSSLL